MQEIFPPNSSRSIKKFDKSTYEISYECNPRLPMSMMSLNEFQHMYSLKTATIKCNQYIENSQYQAAMALSNKIIKDKFSFDLHAFKGLGNLQSWKGHFVKRASGWVTGKRILNVFDLLSICFHFWIGNNKKKLEHCLRVYERLLQDQERFEIYFGMGNLYYNAKMFALAEKAYIKALDLNKNYAKIYEYLGWIHGYWLGNTRLACFYLEFLQRQTEKSLSRDYLAALLQKQPQTRESLLRAIQRENPNSYRVYLDLAQVQASKHKKVQFLNKCLQIDESYIQAYLMLSETKRKERRYDQAKEFLELAKKKSPIIQDDLPYYMGKILQDQEEFDKAIEQYKECLTINKYNVHANLALAKLLHKKGDINSAIERLQAQLIANPHDFQSANLLGLYFTENSRKQQAIASFQKAIYINEDYVPAYINLAERQFKDKNYEEARKNLQAALRIDPKNGYLYNKLAMYYVQMKNVTMTIELCLRSIETKDSSYEEAYILLIDAYKMQNNFEKAFEYYLQYSLQSKDFHAEQIYNKLLAYLPKEQAKYLLQSALDQYEDEHILVELGKLAQRIGESQLATECFSKINLNIEEQTYSCKLLEEVANFSRGNEELSSKIGITSYIETMSLIKCRKPLCE